MFVISRFKRLGYSKSCLFKEITDTKPNYIKLKHVEIPIFLIITRDFCYRFCADRASKYVYIYWQLLYILQS